MFWSLVLDAGAGFFYFGGMNRDLKIILIVVASLLLLYAAINLPGFQKGMDETSARVDEMMRRTEDREAGRAYLETCLVCRKEVSSDAVKCPHCGDPR